MTSQNKTAMTEEQSLAALTAKIVEAVPGLMQSHAQPYGDDVLRPRPITLEDVLRALDKSEEAVWIAADGFWSIGERADQKWTLGKPLSEQSPETIQFLSSLLHGE